MQYAVINSKQLLETDRWDAGFNIAYHQHKARLNEILNGLNRPDRWANGAQRRTHFHQLAKHGQKYGRLGLQKVALSLPLDAEAFDKVAPGSAPRTPSREAIANLRDLELALYVTLATTPEKLESINRQLARQRQHFENAQQRFAKAVKQFTTKTTKTTKTA